MSIFFQSFALSKIIFKVIDWLKDLRVVLRPLWFYIVFLLFGVVAFLIMPQGNDMIYCIIEDSIDLGFSKLGPLIFILIATVLWSCSIYFCTLLIMWVSDLSSDGLNDNRVINRINLIDTIPEFILFMPVFIISLAFIKAYLIKLPEGTGQIFLYILLMLFLTILIYRWCVKNNFLARIFKREYKGIESRSLIFYLIVLSMLVLNTEIDDRVNRSYFYFFMFLFFLFYLIILFLKYLYLDKWIVKLKQLILPAIKKTDKLERDRLKAIVSDSGDYKLNHERLIPFKFIIKRFNLSVVGSIFVVVFINFLPMYFYEVIGGTAILLISFTCWGLIYTFLTILSKIKLLRFPLFSKAFLTLLLIFSSYYGEDHTIRKYKGDYKSNGEIKKDLPSHFDGWFTTKYDVSQLNERDSGNIPVIFISAEGGALRTGCFTSYMLSTLESKIVGFSDMVYCYSSVSGGTFGCNIFNSLLLDRSISKSRYSNILDSFYSKDYLSPLTAKLANGEILNYIYWKNVEQFDRAVTMEKSWEQGLEFATGKPSFLQNSFRQINDNPSNSLVLINTSELNSGKRYIISNIKIDSSFYSTAGDFNAILPNGFQINYSTAIGLSARFPLVSPAGTIIKDSLKYQFVDGGYFENTGALTLKETIDGVIRGSKYGKFIKPIVIQISFGFASEYNELNEIEKKKYSKKRNGVNFMNEITEIINGIYNVRSGHSYAATYELRKKYPNYFEYFPRASSSQLPMNWVLSNDAIKRVKSMCNDFKFDYLNQKLLVRSELKKNKNKL